MKFGNMVRRRTGDPDRLMRIGHAGGIEWPRATARLTEGRSKAEICVASFKGHGNADQVSPGLTYDSAKALSMGSLPG
jgi:hypothetical protein